MFDDLSHDVLDDLSDENMFDDLSDDLYDDPSDDLCNYLPARFLARSMYVF